MAITRFSPRSLTLAFMALTAFGATGCSKDVRKTGENPQNMQPALLEPTAQVWTEVPTVEQVASEPGITQPPAVTAQPIGICGDPIGAMQGPSLTLPALTGQAWGSWDLVDYKTFVVATKQDGRQGMSHIEGTESGFDTVCQNMDQLPQGNFSFQTDLPRSISAEDGLIDEEILVKETVVGDRSSQRALQSSKFRQAQCGRLGKMIDPNATGLAAPGCEPAQFYRVGENEVVMLKVSRKTDHLGNTLLVKTLAKYELWGEGRTIPKVPSRKPAPVPSATPTSAPTQTPSAPAPIPNQKQAQQEQSK